MSASDYVHKHNPTILKRTITEFSSTDDDWKGHDTIRVIGRFRPSNKKEKAYSKQNNISDKPPKYDNEQQCTLQRGITSRKSTGSKAKPWKCTLDSILNPKTSQRKVFYLVGQPAILSCLQGFNSTIFAYGQSGSGKTYTMFGPENDTLNVEQFGLIPRCFIYLFQNLNKSLSQNGGNLQEFKVSMQFVQIYKRELLDLLNPNLKCKTKLIIKTDFRNDSIFVQNLRSVEISTVEEAFACLTEAQSNRIVASHALNEVSSRSHMLVMVNLIQRNVDGCVSRSKLNFGDLAGSEDLTKALGNNPDPERRQEAIAINSSLSALTTAISYLSKGKNPSYRDSPLTHILKDSLGGNSKTVMFVACSPHIYNRNETIRTLRFAQTAKKVKNKAKKNEEQSPGALKKRIKELELKVASLQAQLVETIGKQHVISKVMSGNKSVSFNMPNTISISMSVDHNGNEEWSGDEEEAVHVFSDQELMDYEEELNYIQEIGELRKQLEDALKQNNMLGGEINGKNIELEQCNNKIAELSDENNKIIKLSYTEDVSQSDEQKDDNNGTKNLGKIPDSMPTINDDDMLQYLMELQVTMKQAKKYLDEFKEEITTVEFSEGENTTESEDGSDDIMEIEKREKQLDVALKKNLTIKKNKSFLCCFAGGYDSDNENDNETSLLVEEYLKNHTRKEMKKQTKKYKKRNKKKLKNALGTKLKQDEFSNDTMITESPSTQYIHELHNKRSVHIYVEKLGDSGRHIIDKINNKNISI